MVSKAVSNPSSRSTRVELLAIHRSAMRTGVVSDSPRKRPRTDGTASDPLMTDSDSEKDLAEPTVRRFKRMKPGIVERSISGNDESESSDDEPLINGYAARTSTQPDSSGRKPNSSSSMLKMPRHITDQVPRLAESAAQLTSAAVEFHHNGRRFVGDTPILAPGRPTPSPSKRSVYGDRVNLTPVFASAISSSEFAVSPVAGYSPAVLQHRRLDHAASKCSPKLHRRMPTPTRQFTNMRLIDVNRLILSMPAYEEEEARRAARSKGKVATAMKHVIGQDRVAVQERSADGENSNMESKMSADDSSDFESHEFDFEGVLDDQIGGHAGGSGRRAEYKNERPSAEQLEEQSAVIPSTIEMNQLSDDHTQDYDFYTEHPTCYATSSNTPDSSRPLLQITHTAHASSTIHNTDTSHIVDLGEDDDDMFVDVCTETSTTTTSKANPEREKVFLSTFHSRWWLGGFSTHAAVDEVNKQLGGGHVSFGQEEGHEYLFSLADQGKLAIRHGRVYHLDQDPGADAPAPSPVIDKTPVSTPTQVFRKDVKNEVRGKALQSPFKHITEARFQEFDQVFYFVVMMSVDDGLFKVKVKAAESGGKKTSSNGAWRNRSSKDSFHEERQHEPVGKIVEAVNKYTDEEYLFSVKEVSAALLYMQSKGQVLLENQDVKLIRLE